LSRWNGEKPRHFLGEMLVASIKFLENLSGEANDIYVMFGWGATVALGQAMLLARIYPMSSAAIWAAL
jgi:hypothetical protein